METYGTQTRRISNYFTLRHSCSICNCYPAHLHLQLFPILRYINALNNNNNTNTNFVKRRTNYKQVISLLSVLYCLSVRLSLVSVKTTFARKRCQISMEMVLLNWYCAECKIPPTIILYLKFNNKKLCSRTEAAWCFEFVSSYSFNITIHSAQSSIISSFVTLASDLPMLTIKFCSVVSGVTSRRLSVIDKIHWCVAVHRPSPAINKLRR